ncbi:MAG: DUF4136 domain-containing protein [Sphingomonadaceae bacterium]|nr:DUF4136 domain-containing protein [Sphingomonadaceae bacterium]
MENHAKSGIGRLKLVAVAALVLALSACASPFRADVSRFQSQLPAPAGQSFAVVADDPNMTGGIEFGRYADLVTAQMTDQGYSLVEDPETAQLLVRFDYGVDKGRERIRSTGISRSPYWSPWYGYGRHGYWGPYRGGLWSYGWHDPWFDNGIDSYTVYTSGIDVKIDRRADGTRLFEGTAEAVSRSNKLQYLVPNLVEAMFTNFPGNSGETVRITIAPEDKKQN